MIEDELRNNADRFRSESQLNLPRSEYCLGSDPGGNIVHLIPSPWETSMENVLVHGNNEWTTKTAYNIASQSFWTEHRTWIIIDQMFDYIGNDVQNEHASPILEFDSIPAERMDVISPRYFLEMLHRDDIVTTGITEKYTIPFRHCSISNLVEMMKLNEKASYLSMFEIMLHELQFERHGMATVQDLIAMMENAMQDPGFPSNMVWTVRMLIDKLNRVHDALINDDPWSSIGSSLFKALSENQPRWIVLTLGHALSPVDLFSMSMIDTVLTELRKFCELLRVNGIRMNIGVMVNNIDTLMRNGQSGARAVHDLINAWGRTSRVYRLCTANRADDLPKEYFARSRSRALFCRFQDIIECRNNGTASLLDSCHVDDRESSNGEKLPRVVNTFTIAEPSIKVTQDRASPSFDGRSIALAEALERPSRGQA